jgi:hypothetical protein
MAEKESIPPNNDTPPQTQMPKEPSEAEKTISVHVLITPFEKECLDSFAKILANLDIGNGVKIVKEDNLGELTRVALASMTSMYMTQVFPDSRIIERLPNKKIVKEFVAFRKKYMRYPVDAQIADLKRLGLLGKA